jgi:hypothetical protein
MTDLNQQEAQDNAMLALVKDLGIDSLPQDKQNEIIIKMTEVLLKRIFIETMDRLGDEGRMEYEKLTEVEQIDQEKVTQFLKDKIANYDEMVNGIIEDFKMEMAAK